MRFWSERDWIRILVFSGSRIIFGFFVLLSYQELYVRQATLQDTNTQQDIFGYFNLRFRSRMDSDPKISYQDRIRIQKF